MATLQFIFTEQASYKATNVTEVNSDANEIEYTQTVTNDDSSVVSVKTSIVDKSDLLYAVLTDSETKEVIVLPGIFTQFNIVPVGPAVQRQENIEAEADRVKAYRELKAPERAAKEAAKFAARRAARKAEWVGTSPSVPAVTKGHGKTSAIDDLVEKTGLNEKDIQILRSIGVVK